MASKVIIQPLSIRESSLKRLKEFEKRYKASEADILAEALSAYEVHQVLKKQHGSEITVPTENGYIKPE